MKCKFLTLTVAKDRTGKNGYVSCCSRKWVPSETAHFEKVKNALGIVFVKCPQIECPYREE